MNLIRLFIASSNELAELRNKFDTWIAHKNRILEEHDFQFRVVADKWEFESTAYPANGRSQDEYNKLIKRADIVAVLVKNKVGRYTAEEFDEAVKLFQSTGKPRVSVYSLPVELGKAEKSLEDFLKALRDNQKSRDYFLSATKNYDELWNMIDNELDRAIDWRLCSSSATYTHPISYPLKLEELLRTTGYHATALDKEDSNGSTLEADISADDFCSKLLYDEVMKNRSVIIVGEGGSGKSTLIARFFKTAKEKAKLFYIPVFELDYGLNTTRQVTISDYLFREYFKNKSIQCKKSTDVFSFISGMDDAIFILDGYNELEYYYTDDGGWITRNQQLDNDITALRHSSKNHVIITSRSDEDTTVIRSDFVLYKLQRISRNTVREFLNEREELLKEKHYISDGDRNELVENLTTPILLNAFDGILRSSDLLIRSVSLGMFECPINRGQIFYNYLCNEMFKNRDTHVSDKEEYAVRGLMFFRYVVPFIARKYYEGNRTYLTQKDIVKDLKLFIECFNNKYVESDIFDDLNAVARAYNTTDLMKFVTADIGDGGDKALDILIGDYHILKTERAGGGGREQRYSFEHPTLGEVLAMLDIWNQMALQSKDEVIDIANDIMAKPLPAEIIELMADFYAIKED